MNSEEELIDKVQSPDFVEDSIKAAIIFKNYSPNWKYELRMNASEEFINGVPDTEQIEVEFTTNFQSLTFFDEYLGSQFPMIQAVVDEWIMMKELNLNDGFVSLFSLYVNKFPSPAYSTEDFWALMENMAVLLILITVNSPTLSRTVYDSLILVLFIVFVVFHATC